MRKTRYTNGKKRAAGGPVHRPISHSPALRSFDRNSSIDWDAAIEIEPKTEHPPINRYKDLRPDPDFPAYEDVRYRKRADGGEVDDSSAYPAFQQEMRASPFPTGRERMANFMMGDGASLARRNFVKGVTGSTGMGETGLGLVDFTPLGWAMRAQEGLRSGSPREAAMEAVPGAGAAKAMFVGPFGAFMLRQADRNLTKPHPVYAKSGAMKNAERLRPEFQDIYKKNQVDMRDAYGRYALETRPMVGNKNDRDVFAKTGWSFAPNSTVPTKEVPDIGTKIKKVGPNAYKLDHRQGDLHSIYGVPPMKEAPEISWMYNARGAFHPKTNEIQFAKKKDAVDVGLHEMQHAIQKAEGMPKGSTGRTIDENEAFYSYIPDWQKEYMIKYLKAKPENFGVMGIGPDQAARSVTHARASGEQQSFNVQDRRKKSFRYQSHPEDTERLGRGIQTTEYHKAAGGSVNPGLGAAIGMSRQANSGLLRSDVPGRTDKLPINIPSGSYVIPADTVSALGQGNTQAGSAILGKMFNKGPYGMNLPKRSRATSTRMNKKLPLKSKFADGGPVEDVPVIAAGGEFIVTPEQVAMMGAGDPDLGFKVLDRFVTDVRKNTIKELKSLKPPRKD